MHTNRIQKIQENKIDFLPNDFPSLNSTSEFFIRENFVRDRTTYKYIEFYEEHMSKIIFFSYKISRITTKALTRS